MPPPKVDTTPFDETADKAKQTGADMKAARQGRAEGDRRPAVSARVRGEAELIATGVVEDAVNAVGVDVNTASAKLLARVSGIGDALTQSIVLYREANGAFRSRAALKELPRLGPRAFELSVGFLRINGGENPLDRSGVHPEAYPPPSPFVDATFGLPTVIDIFRDLEKPGRDPRPPSAPSSSRRTSRRSAISSRA